MAISFLVFGISILLFLIKGIVAVYTKFKTASQKRKLLRQVTPLSLPSSRGSSEQGLTKRDNLKVNENEESGLFSNRSVEPTMIKVPLKKLIFKQNNI